MAEAVPETIDKATRAAEMLGRPNVLVSVLLVGVLAGAALLVYRDEVRADAQIKVFESMVVEMRGVKAEVAEQRRAFQSAGIHLRAAAAVQASDREPE